VAEAEVQWVERIGGVVAEVADAMRRAGRDPGAATIVAVTKTLPPTAVHAAAQAGLRDVGENYVQEARDKRTWVGDPVRWHLIGTLQRNKAKLAARVFDRIHSIDGVALARALDDAAASSGSRLAVLLQVDPVPGRARRGVPPEDLCGLAREVARCRHLAFDGLMTIAPPGVSVEETRSCFRAVRELRNDLAHTLGLELPQLSMGMSGDFCIAIEEGATLLRLGQVLFGARGPRPWREAS
jgi:pyridoxal phosphate enzyme (YggS family)